jgi:hypothetical protein
MDGGEELNVLHHSLSLLYYRFSFESTIFIKLIPAAVLSIQEGNPREFSFRALGPTIIDKSNCYILFRLCHNRSNDHR